jgi:hypothetical protein
MASMPVPPDPGGDDDVCELQQGLRLSDAEGIAAQRLDGAAEGSLREALAIATPDDAGNAGPALADRIAEVGESFAAGPLIRLIDARFAEAGRTQVSGPHYTFSPMPRPPVLDVGIALVMRADSAPTPSHAALEIATAGDPACAPSEDWQGVADDTPPALAAAPPVDAAAAQRMQPLASAFDAAVQLAADANVAAEALENLKRMLEHKQQLESQLPQLAAGSAHARASNDAEAPASAPAAPAPPPLPLLPLPLHAVTDAEGEPAPAMLPPPRRRPPPEHRAFDVRGFMAGFALSWAFGVVLYLFMTAG